MIATYIRHKPLRISGHPARARHRARRPFLTATSLFESQGIRLLGDAEGGEPEVPPQASSNLRASGRPPPRGGRAGRSPPQASSNLRASGGAAARKGVCGRLPATSLFESQGIRRAQNNHGRLTTMNRHKPLRISGHPAPRARHASPPSPAATSLFESQGIRHCLRPAVVHRVGPPQASSNLRASGRVGGSRGASYRCRHKPLRISGHPAAWKTFAIVPPSLSRHKPLRISGHPAGARPGDVEPDPPPQASSNLRASGSSDPPARRRWTAATSLFESQGIRPTRPPLCDPALLPPQASSNLRASGRARWPGWPRAPSATSLFESQGIRPRPHGSRGRSRRPPQASSNLRASGNTVCSWLPLWFGVPPQASSNLRASGRPGVCSG